MHSVSIRHSTFDIRYSRQSRALTLVELLIVIVVIGILVSAILVASSGFINKGRANNTQSVLQIVADAVEDFKREQSIKPTITRADQDKQGMPGKKVTYAERYGFYPPDELEVFTSAGLRGCDPASVTDPCRTLAPGAAQVVGPTPPPWNLMRFYKDGTDADALENRDQAAMILAIETLSESASAILDRIPDRNRTVGALQADGTPALFLDRTGGATGTWDANDHQIRLIVDDWGNPISYLAERDWQPASSTFAPIRSSNHDKWNQASTEIIRLNGGQPVIFSYGPNGKDQLAKDVMGANGTATLMGDMHPATPGPDDQPYVIDNPFNADNVYSNPALKEKLGKGIKAP